MNLRFRRLSSVVTRSKGGYWLISLSGDVLKPHLALTMLIVDSESELSLEIRLECCDKDSKRRVTSVLDGTIHCHGSRNLVSTIIGVLRRGKPSITDSLAIEVVDLESDTNLVVLAAHSLQVEFNKDFNRHAFVLCLDKEQFLRIVPNCVEI